jgi:hypothetical protein
MARIRKIVLPLLVAVACLLGMTAGQARADILVTLDLTTVVTVGSTTTYGYTAFLNPGSQLNNTGTIGNTNTGDLFTLYDIPGYIPGSATSALTGFGSITEQNVGITPNFQGPPDSSAMTNVTFHYTSSAPTQNPGPNTNLLLGTFTIGSTIATPSPTANIFYSAATQKFTPGSPSDMQPANNTSLVAGPAIPEPASLALLAIGTPVMGVFYLLRRRNQTLAI